MIPVKKQTSKNKNAGGAGIVETFKIIHHSVEVSLPEDLANELDIVDVLKTDDVTTLKLMVPALQSVDGKAVAPDTTLARPYFPGELRKRPKRGDATPLLSENVLGLLGKSAEQRRNHPASAAGEVEADPTVPMKRPVDEDTRHLLL
jgi:hypothetical protein